MSPTRLNNYFQRCCIVTREDIFLIFNKDVQAVLDKHGIKIYTTENEEKSSIVERWNRTIKENLFKHVSASNSTQYLAVLPKIVNDYNLSKHRAIKMSPVEAKYGNMKREKKKKIQCWR